MKQTALSLLVAALSVGASATALGTGGHDDAPRVCQQLYQEAYENSYDTLDMLEKLGRTELCFAEVNDQVLQPKKVQLSHFRDSFGALCSMLADAAHADNNSLVRIYNLQCRVEAERGLTNLIGSYLNQKDSGRTIAVWDEMNDDRRLDRMQAITHLHADLADARLNVVEHFIASIRETFPERDESEIKNRVEQTLAKVQRPDAICEELGKLTPDGGVCTSDVTALSSGLIYQYADLN